MIPNHPNTSEFPLPSRLAGPSTATLPEEQGRRPKPLSQVLVELGAVTPGQIAEAQQAAGAQQSSLAQVLVREGLISSRDMAALLALHLGLPMIDLRSQVLDPAALEAIPEQIARRYVVLPLKKNAGRITLAMADPSDYGALQDLRVCAGCSIQPVIATSEDILEHLDVSYRRTETGGAQDESTLIPAKAADGKVTARQLQDSPPAQVIELLLQQAIQDRASDIHISPVETRLRVRFRIDGLLHDVMTLPQDMHPLMLSRLKIMAGLNIAERRRPQDGHFSCDVDGRRIDVRVAISNTVYGEMSVLRLLDKQFTLLGLDQVGMSPELLEPFRKLLHLPHGMVIVCGPTGAGKSTTLYASILEMNRLEQNVISLEDPVEYQIPNTNQMQIHAEAGITFATQLRSILRLDPDVILVGEIRDQETATIATQAAMTGHLVLTSLHANDSVSALMRLRDLNVAPYLIATSVAGILSQRMVRVVCSGCKTTRAAPPMEQEAFQLEMREEQRTFAYGLGCNVCAHTGYRGRTGVFELLNISDELRQLFLADAPRGELQKQAFQDGLIPLKHAGMSKVKLGVTTPYEIMRVLFTLD